MIKSRDARKLQRCNKCYWFVEHSCGSGDPDTCRWDPDKLWDIINDKTRAIECEWYVARSEIDKLARSYCRIMAASPKIPEPEFLEDRVRTYVLRNSYVPWTPVEIFYED